MPPRKRNPDSTDNAQKKKRRKRKNSDDDFDEEIKVPGFLQQQEEDNAADDPALDITLEGSLSNGELLICGGTNWDLIGRSQVPKGTKNAGGPNLWGPNRVGSMKGIRVRTVVSGCTACHSIIITTDGKAYSWGRNEKGQLGHGDTQRRDVPTIVECLDEYNIVDAACGKNHTLFLTEKGRVLACGDNKMGQLGLGLQSPFVPSPTRINYKGPPIRKVSCGGEFCMIADIRGNLYSFGCPEYGQLGHNTDGKFFVTSNKLSFKCETSPRKVNVFIEKAKEGYIIPIPTVDVRDVACGINHTIIVDAQKRVFTWGFGGYGRLGHSEQKDEMVPRHLKYFDGPSRGAVTVFAGSTFCLATSELGALYLWGQTKSSGEAAMYPKLVPDLSGWRIRSVACCNKSIVVAADESVISWGASPTYGELGYGDSKARSSTIPQEMKILDGLYIHNVSCGYGHTLLIVRADTEVEKQKLEKLPVFSP